MDGQQIQVENGNFARVHNAILERLAVTRLDGTEFRCIMFLLRKTYGHGKKEDRISLAQWADGTKMQRQNVWLILQELQRRRIVYAISHGPKRPITWGFNKYFEQWDTPIIESVMPQHYSEESVMPEDDSSVMLQHDSFAESVMPEHDSSISDSTPSVMLQHDKSVMLQHDYKRKKDNSSSSSYIDQPAKATAAAAASIPDPPIPKPSMSDTKYASFVKEYENVWCLPITPHHAEKMQDWCKRVPVEAWSYALKESADTRNVGNWKYFETILRRVEIEGLSPARQAQMPPPIQSGKTGLSLGKILSTAGAMT